MTIKPVVIFKQHSPKGPNLHADVGAGFVTPTVPGGWATTTRPRDKAISEWTGNGLITMDIPILFDGFAANQSVESEIKQLYSMMRKPVGKREEPPVIRMGGQFPVPFKHLDWVINAVTPGIEERRHRDGHRTRAGFTVTLLEYVPGDVLVKTKDSPAKRHQQKGQGDKDKDNSPPRTYTVKKGDTLQSIAAKLLGKQSRWHEIKDLNNIRDPKNIKVGQKLKIPR